MNFASIWTNRKDSHTDCYQKAADFPFPVHLVPKPAPTRI